MLDPFSIDVSSSQRSRHQENHDVHAQGIESNTSLMALGGQRHIIFLVAIITICLLFLLGRMVQVQLISGSSFRVRSDYNRVRLISIPAPRGAIVDRNNVMLAENIPNITLSIIPADLPKNTAEKNKVLENISTRTLIPLNEIISVLQANRQRLTDPVIIKEQIEYTEALHHVIALADIPAVSIISLPNRSYPHGKQTSTVLGYTGRISPQQLAQDSTAHLLDTVGKTGLELTYNKELTGQDGEKKVERDVRNREQRIISQREAIPGQTLVTTIDLPLQQQLNDRLQATVSKLRAPGGAAIAMDPQTGEILALASAPSYDNNIFVTANKNTEIQKLLVDGKKPLLNRVISGQYPSGSIIKPLIASAALSERIITPSTTVRSVGGFTVGNDNFPDWKAGGHGLTNVTKAMAESVNTFFYAIGGGFENITGLGVNRITAYLQKFGWGQPTGIDLPAEENGLLPTKVWRDTKRLSPWKLGDTYHLSIGQGDVEVTPLQIISSIAAIANGGQLLTPHVVKEIRQANGQVSKSLTTKIINQQVVSSTVLATVQSGMRQGVLSGSSRALQSLPVTSAGKTGTAQFGAQGKTHAWFAAYAPYDQPKIVMVILIEAGGEGNATALPIAKEVLQWYFTEGAGKPK